MMKLKKLGYGLFAVLVLWALTALYGVPTVIEGVQTEHAESSWGARAAVSPDSAGCYEEAIAIAPLLVAVTEGCWSFRGVGYFSGGGEGQHVHLWFLAGQKRLFTLWSWEE